MQTIPRPATQAAWHSLIAFLAVLLFLPLPAWFRSGIDPDILGQILEEAHALFADNAEGANADYTGLLPSGRTNQVAPGDRL